MKRILFPTDFSENAENAIRYGLSLFKEEKAQFILLHTLFIPYTSGEVPIVYSDLSKEAVQKKLQELLQRINQRFPRESYYITTELEMGDIEGVISGKVKEGEVDVVVMGTTGAGGLTGLLVGSNASAVVSSVKCPVFVIPGRVALLTPRKIALAVDTKEEIPEDSLRFLIEIREKYNSEILILHVETDEGAPARSLQELEWTRHFGDTELSFHTIREKDVVQGIDHFVHENNVSLLVLVKSNLNLFQRIFHNSITRKMALHTDIPLLVLHQ